MADSIEGAALGVAQSLTVCAVLAGAAWLGRQIQTRWRMTQHKTYVRTEEPENVTAGEMGRMVGITAAQVSALYERGFLLPVPRVGRQRAIPVTDREKVKAAAIKAGYLKE